jgi:hypothetical protein
MRTTLVLAMILGICAISADGRQRPVFSGGWTPTTDAPPGLTAAPSPVFGARFWMEHQGDRLTVVRPVRTTAMRAEHAIGGEDARTRVPGATCLGDAAVVTRADWEGDAIVHTTVASIPPGGATTVKSGLRHVFRMDGPDRLVVQSTMRVPNQTEPVNVGTVYRRMTDAPPPALALPDVTPAPATLAGLSWLAGTWAGTIGTAEVEERWTPAEGGAMLATSRTVRNTAVAEFEFLCVAERAGSLVYSAMPNARAPATDFMLTGIEKGSATFENPAHDFPRKIRYALRPDGTLEATVTGAANQRALVYVFSRR